MRSLASGNLLPIETRLRSPPPSTPHFEPSTTFTGGVEKFDPTVRNSSKAQIPRTNLIKCIEARAREFQGWPQDTFIEKLWAQRYGTGGHYVHHYDWGHAGSRH